jgi:hypothetical protein
LDYAAADVDQSRTGTSGAILRGATKLAGEDVLTGLLDPHHLTLKRLSMAIMRLNPVPLLAKSWSMSRPGSD